MGLSLRERLANKLHGRRDPQHEVTRILIERGDFYARNHALANAKAAVDTVGMVPNKTEQSAITKLCEALMTKATEYRRQAQQLGSHMPHDPAVADQETTVIYQYYGAVYQQIQRIGLKHVFSNMEKNWADCWEKHPAMPAILQLLADATDKNTATQQLTPPTDTSLISAWGDN